MYERYFRHPEKPACRYSPVHVRIVQVLYSTSLDSNDVISYPIGNVEYIGSKQIFYRNDSNILCSKNIETGKITTWNSTKAVEWSRIVGSSSQGVLLYAEETTTRVYCFLNFRNGSMEPLLKQ